MINLFSILLSSIFVLLSLIHFNWTRGGVWGFETAIPTNEEGEKIFNPRPIESFVVAFGLLLFAIFYLTKSGIINIYLPQWINILVSWIIPTIFFVRAVGEFKYVGFFKKMRKSKFAEFDTKYFSPLCLFIALLGIYIAII